MWLVFHHKKQSPWIKIRLLCLYENYTEALEQKNVNIQFFCHELYYKNIVKNDILSISNLLR